MKLVSNLASKGLSWPVTEPIDGGGVFYQQSSNSWSGDEISKTFESYVEKAYKTNGIVFACVLARMMPFSEARFQYQELADGNPGKLFNGPGLDLLERPWANATTGDLLSRMEQDGSLAGNFYSTPVAGRMRRLRADWVTIVSGVRGDSDGHPYDLNAEILGYFYEPPGRAKTLITPDRMVHYAPIPDPMAQWRGMSWLTPVLSEVSSDTTMTAHKHKFLKRGAHLSFAVTYDPSIPPAKVREYAAAFAESYEGTANAGKTLHIGGGADPKSIGTNFKDLDFKAVQGAGETRIAAAAGVGAIMARFSEGMQGSSLNQGNYEAAKRQFADMTLRPLWRGAAGALSKVTTPPANSRLWYDTRDIEFLKADRKDAAEIQSLRATTISALVTGGYTPESAIEAVESDDFGRLVHSGMYSIQLQSPLDSNPLAPLPPAELAGLLQKIYLAVTANVITAEEAREIANRAGAGLTGSAPTA